MNPQYGSAQVDTSARHVDRSRVDGGGLMARSFPTDAESITADWLSKMIGIPVSDFVVTTLEGGVVSDIFRVHDVHYSGPSGEAPTSFIVKVAAASADRRQIAVACGAYLKELNFYRLLAPQTPIRTPTIYACVDDGDTSPTRFAILMEDLTVRSTVFDQIDDPPNEADARQIALEAARLHAYYWESDVTRLPWLGSTDGRYESPLDAVCRAAPANFPVFSARWREMYGAELFERDRFDEATRLCELLCGPSSDLILNRIYDVLSSRPKTLLHGDMRADNVFRSNPPSPAGQTQLTFIDWQLMHVGPPGPELTEAWVTSLEPDVRRNDLKMLHDYRDELVELNPAADSYTHDMLTEDYALGHCFWLTTLITAGAATLPSFNQPENARMKRLWEKMMTRVLTAATDHSCLPRVESILDSA
jgi:hypothetical protein